jgi:hypothetical protein
VEASPRYHLYARTRFQTYPQVQVELGDSRSFLRRLAARGPAPSTLFYLDAHWEDDLPFREEVEIIAGHWDRAVVIIDDFEVADDPGYYSYEHNGNRLSAGYLPDTGWSLFYPAAKSSEETGAKSGCGILVSPALVPAVKGLASVREATPRPS